MKGFFQRLVNGGAQTAGEAVLPQLTLAAFGKHPGWDDHIPGIGVETETLAHVKQSLYVSGIGGQIDSGAWEKLEAGKRVEGFNHVFLWLRPGRILLGQFWSSVDRKGRTKYPMVLCVESQGVSPRFLLTQVRPELDQLRDTCRAKSIAEQVTAECASAQERLRAMLSGQGSASSQAVVPVEVRRKFIEHRALGPDRLGLLRVQHELASAFDTVFSEGSSAKAIADLNARHLRVPLAGDSRAGQLVVWAEFLQAAVPAGVPILLLSREGVDWLDVVVGEPAKGDFFCLQASPAALPLATEIPYEMPPEAKPRLVELEARFLNPAAVSATTTPTLANGAAASAGAGKPWLAIVAVVVVLLVVAGWMITRGGGKPATPKQIAAAPAAEKTQPVSAVPSEAEARRLADEKTKADAEARRLADEKAQAEAKFSAEEKAKAVADARRLGQEKRAAEEKAKAEAEAKRLAEQKAKSEAQRVADEKAGADAAANRIAEEKRSADEKAAAEAKRLADDKLERERNFKAAMELARTALGAKDFAKAIEEVTRAIAILPDDASGAKFKADARKQLDVIRAAQVQQNVERLLASGRAALDAKNYSDAAAKADEALKLRPGDAEAAALKNSAAVPADLEAAQSFFDKQAYDQAAGLCARHTGVAEFDALAKKIVEAQKQTTEQQVQSQLAQLDVKFEILRVQFGMLKSSAAASAEARAATRLRPPIDAQFFLRETDDLEAKYRAGGWLVQNDREKNLKKLKQEILYTQ
ncbi:MAG: hypothetical protein EXS35_05330 [Pedosphaera sp.]|nr:hypothetical protein [Pedosphaera sp.]